MRNKLSIFAIALSLIAPAVLSADNKPGKPPTTSIQPKPKLTAQQSKAPQPSTSSNSAKAAPSPYSGNLRPGPNRTFDQPQNLPVP
jgi:hypothetical protein